MRSRDGLGKGTRGRSAYGRGVRNDRGFAWERGEVCKATVMPGTRFGVAAGREPDEPHWNLERSNGETLIGPVYLPGEENPPGWSGAVARFEEVLDQEVEPT